MLEKLRPWFKHLIGPIARGLVSIGVTADMVTVFGAVGTIVVSLATGITGWLVPGSVLLAVFVVFDSLDGSVAALTTGGTKFGAFLDSTLDRIADWAVLIAVVLYFLLHSGMSRSGTAMTRADIVAWVGIGSTLYAMMTSFVTSYARARAESVGYEAKNGIATRSDRLVIILVGMLLSGIFSSPVWLMIFEVILALLGTVTVFQRILTVRRQMSADEALHGPETMPRG